MSVYFHNIMLPLKKALENIGLNTKALDVLSVLLEGGAPMLVSVIAKISKLNRTTTYDILKELETMGLVSKVKKEGAVRYQAIAVELLPAYIERRRESLEETKTQLLDIIPQIKLLRSKGNVLPKVQFFEGEEGVKQAYEDVLESNKEKLLRGITGMDAVYKNMGESWTEYFLKKRTRYGIRCTNLVPETGGGKRSKDDDAKYIRTTKFLPPQYNFEGDISIYDNKVNIASFARENPIAVIIEDDAIATMMKRFFDFAAEKAE